MNKQALLLHKIRVLCTQTEGMRGIWKRLDENRELLEFLQQNAPDVLRRFPFIEGWLGNHDIFFMNLLTLLELPLSPEGLGAPRKWPGNPCIEKAYMNFSPAIAITMSI